MRIKNQKFQTPRNCFTRKTKTFRRPDVGDGRTAATAETIRQRQWLDGGGGSETAATDGRVGRTAATYGSVGSTAATVGGVDGRTLATVVVVGDGGPYDRTVQNSD